MTKLYLSSEGDARPKHEEEELHQTDKF